jgi:3',5'-cyclic AMP phosphodiesterase CpdA
VFGRALATAALVLAGACGGAPDSLHFAVVGDMGTGGPGQQTLADVIAARAEESPFDFMLTVGDNFYPAGVFGLDDPMWRDAWKNVYDAPSLDVPVYPILGNHDHAGFPYVQLGYGDRDGRWTMPDLFYSWTEQLSDGTEVAFFALDTEPIRAGLDGRRANETVPIREARVRRSLAWNDVELDEDLVRYIAERVHVNDEVTVLRIVEFSRRSGRSIDRALISEAIDAGVEEDYPAQLEWLDEALADSDARWKIVYGHHPLYGHDLRRGHQLSMIERVEPILVRHGVDLYVAGHDHHTDVMKPVDGVHYVTSGGGAGDDHPTPVRRTDESYYVQSGGGFTLYTVSPDRLDIEVVDLEGRTRYTLSLRD